MLFLEHGHHGHSHGNGLARNHSRLSELANVDEADDFEFGKQVIYDILNLKIISVYYEIDIDLKGYISKQNKT